MRMQKVVFGGMLVACLVLFAVPAQAGILWAFQNEGNIDKFTSIAPVNGTVTWDASGKLEVTGDGSSQVTVWGETWDPVSGYLDPNNGETTSPLPGYSSAGPQCAPGGPVVRPTDPPAGWPTAPGNDH